MAEASVTHPPRQVATRPLRLTVVMSGGMFGGAERWQVNVADATDRLDLHVVALGDGETADQWRRRGVPVTVLPASSSAARLPGLSARICRLLRSQRPDAVLAHGVKAAMVTAPAARAVGAPSAWVRHDDSFAGPVADLLDSLTDGQIATNGWLLKGARARRPVVLVPPRVAAAVPRAQARAELGIGPAPVGELLLGMGCRLAPNKGVDDAIAALALPGADRWRLVVAGISDPSHPRELDRLQAHARATGVAERVTFLPAVPDLSRVISAFDALALLTKPVPGERMTAEGFGMVVLEAMTAGVPVISTPPVAQRVGDGGLAVAPADPVAVAHALGELADDQVRTARGAQARRTAEQHPDAVAVADGFVTYLADLVHRPGAGLTPDEPISVVTTVLNEGDEMRPLLEVLAGQLGPDDELVVVDGGSSDGTDHVIKQAAEADARIRLVVAPGAGISAGRNIGIGASRNDVIACTDAGCAPDPGWLTALRAAIVDRPDADLWTGTYRVSARSATERAMAVVGYPQVEELARPTLLVRAYGRVLGRSFDASMPTGRSIAFRRSAWLRVGGFPEHLATGEDVTFGMEIVATGGTATLVRDAAVTWDQRPTLASTLRMYRNYGEGSGVSRNAKLLGRDLARSAAYLGVLPLWHKGGRTGRTLCVLGAAAYLSLPLARALRGPEPLATVALVPPMAAARDLSKAYGALRGLVRGRR